MAYEEFRVGNRMTHASNTYTLGVVLLQLVTGNSPFFISANEVSNSEVGRVNTRDLHKELPNIKTGNIALDNVLKEALQPAPSKRFQTIKEFLEALSALM
jgi:serine/threonine protein kinase